MNFTTNPKISLLPGSGFCIDVFKKNQNNKQQSEYLCMDSAFTFQPAQWLCSAGPYFMHICVYIYIHTCISLCVCVCVCMLINSGHMSLARNQWKHSGYSYFMHPANNRILMTVCLSWAMLTTDKQRTLNLISLLLQEENKNSGKKTSYTAA